MKKQKRRAVISLKMLVISAMLTAIGVVIGIICKTFLDFGGIFRITFENLPIIMSGVLFGPVVGGMVGAAVDIISALAAGQAPLPFVMVGSITVGVVSGVMAKYIVRQKGTRQIALSAAAAHLIGSMIIKPIALFTIYEWAVLFRIPIYMVIAPIEIFILCLLFKNRSFCRVTEYH